MEPKRSARDRTRNHADRRLCWRAGSAHEKKKFPSGRCQHGLSHIRNFSTFERARLAGSEHGALHRWRSIYVRLARLQSVHGPKLKWPYLTEFTTTMGSRYRLRRPSPMGSRWKVHIPIPRISTTVAVQWLRIRSGIQSPRCFGFAKRADGVSPIRISGITSRRIMYGTSPRQRHSKGLLARFSATGKPEGS